MSETRSTSWSFPLLIPMFLIMFTLKLCGVIDWSWWWVTAPLWGPFALVLAFLAGAVILWCIASPIGWVIDKCSKKNTRKYGRN